MQAQKQNIHFKTLLTNISLLITKFFLFYWQIDFNVVFFILTKWLFKKQKNIMCGYFIIDNIDFYKPIMIPNSIDFRLWNGEREIIYLYD